MVKTFIISLLVLSSIYLATAQTVFNNVYDYGDNFQEGVAYFNEIPNSSRSIILSSYSEPFNADENGGIRIFIIDSTGNVLKDTVYSINKGVEVGTGIVFEEDFIYVLGATMDTAENNFWDTFILKLTYDLDSVYSQIIDIGYNDAGAELKKTGINEFKFISYVYIDSTILENSQIAVVTIDTLGNIQDTWLYGDIGYEFAYDWEAMNDGGFLIVGQENDYPLETQFDLFAMEIDSSGNIVWQQNYGNANDETLRTFNYLEPTKDGGLLIAAEEYTFGISSNVQAKLLKIDSIGNEEWQKNIEIGDDYTISTSVRLWTDDNIILSGNTGYENIIPFTEPRGYIMCLTADGDSVLWQHVFSKWWLDDADSTGNGTRSQDYTHDMILTSDGGILVGGYQIHPFATRNDGWLIKFDSCGYTVGAEPEANFIIDSIVDSTVFITNLSSDYCIATLYFDNGDSLNISAYGNQGDQIQYTFSDTGTYSPYMYAYAGDGIDTFKTASPVITSTRQTLSKRVDFNVSVYPNPAHDYFVVSLGSLEVNSNQDLQVRLFTPTGRLVRTYALNPDLYQQQIYTTDLISSIYLLNFTVDGRSIGNKRLSVIK